MISLNPIGKIVNERKIVEDDDWGEIISMIELNDSFDESALKGIDKFSHLEIIYYFNKVEDSKIITGARHPRNLEHLPEVGVFAQRVKNRPNKLGLTTVKLLRVDNKTLHVKGLDAINGTPVLDIKPVFKQFLPQVSYHDEIKQPDWVNEIMKNYWK
ncbi:MAG: tRNA (N6-threonylcarbamoyladenosine(37)-N6)-methyltransferase TrmO [Ignavibacteria bacterium]|nr:tRNA (N6-threonylcarbamoyladenosine(37)-N6)-methyltransferase TrmO [Ignavibacteria bacterium]